MTEGAAADGVSLRPGGTGGISLRPGAAGLSLRPGGAGLGGPGGGFASFAMGSRPQAPSEASTKRLSAEDVIKYTKEFMLQFQERCTDMPSELATSTLEVVINEINEAAMNESGQWGKKEMESTDSPREGGGKSEKKGKKGGDDKDWSAKKELPPQEGKSEGSGKKRRGGDGGNKGGGGKPDLTKLPEGAEGATIVKASNPWQRGGDQDPKTRTLKTIKGILNKITPEKFERLMEQLLDADISSAEILQETISILFDKAIWEPGFCSMYADVCVRLSKELPEFPAPEGDATGKPMTFRRVLLNTCQEEFEGAAKAREESKAIDDYHEQAQAVKRVKMRTMGNIRLIGELFKKRMIAEKILHACVSDLLGAPKSDPPEENVEALCNLLNTVGKEMDNSPKVPKQMMEMYFARLKALSESKKLDSRIRFLCKDVIELRKAKWVPRRKAVEAKKLDEIHAEAAAALGIAPSAAEDILFPEGPNGPVAEDGWEVVGKQGKVVSSGGGAGESALSGPYVAPKHQASMPTEKEKAKRDAQMRREARERAEAAAAAGAAGGERGEGAGVDGDSAAAEQAGAAAAAEKKNEKYDAEKVEEKVKSMITEYAQVGDVKEAVLCVKDIMDKAADGAAAALAAVASGVVNHVVDSSQEKARDLAAKLLVQCSKDVAGFDAGVIGAALSEPIGMLEDLAIDIPMAPKLLGHMTATLVLAKALESPKFVETSCADIEDVMPKRDFAAAAFKELKAMGPPLKASLDAAGVDVAGFLAGDPEFDKPVGEWLESVGLKELAA